MKLKHLLLGILLLFLSCKASTIKQFNQSKVDHSNTQSNQIQWIKDYIFCECFNSRLNMETKAKIFKIDYSQGMLWDISNGSISFMDSIAHSFSETIRKSQIEDYGNKIPLTANCLEFHRSKKLDSIVRKHYKEFVLQK